jgi:hypothetical protein
MATGYVVLLVVAAAILALRVVLFLRGEGGDADETSYAEPVLRLDEEVEQPHEVFGELASTLEADHDAEGRYLREGESDDTQLTRRMPVSRKVLFAGACAWLLVGIPYLHPKLAWLRLLTDVSAESEANAPEVAGGPMPSASVGEAKLPGATFDQQSRGADLDAPVKDSRGPIAKGGKGDDTVIAPAVDEKKPPRSIEDPKALDKFFAKLTRVESKQDKATANILYYGDSIVASDFVTGKLRRMLQNRFGDAGHGYAIIANAWPGWFHIDVSRKADANWMVSTCVGPYAKDGLYGLGCASFTARYKGIWSQFATADVAKWGRSVSRFELEYLMQPGGGALELIVDDDEKQRIETEGDDKKLAHHTIELSDGPHKLKLVSLEDKPVRLFGIRMERDTGGVTLSAAGITGARARFLDKQDDAHWAEALKAAKPDLFVLAFGSNEVTDGQLYPMDKFKETLELVMDQVERALPDSSYMLVGPPDMASKNASQGHSRVMVHYIVKNQKELAKKRGWAYWDQYRAMGGTGSMWAWMKSGLGAPDLFHPTGIGGNLLGTWEYLALMEAFEKYKEANR